MADGQRSQIGCQPHGHPWSDVCFVCSASTSKVQDHRDRVLSEGRREVGIWSSYGVKEWHHSGIEEGTLGELEISRNHILDSRLFFLCDFWCATIPAVWFPFSHFRNACHLLRLTFLLCCTIQEELFFCSNALIALARSLCKYLLAVLIATSEADAVPGFMVSWCQAV